MFGHFYLWLDFHKLGVIRTLQHRAEVVPTTEEGKDKERTHVKQALQECGYPKWTFNKTNKRPKHDNKENTDKRKGISVPYVSGLSEKLKRIFKEHKVPVYFKPGNTIRQKLVHPKDKTPTQDQANVVYSIHCGT